MRHGIRRAQGRERAAARGVERHRRAVVPLVPLPAISEIEFAFEFAVDASVRSPVPSVPECETHLSARVTPKSTVSEPNV